MGYDGKQGAVVALVAVVHSRSLGLVALLQDSEAVLGWTDMDLHSGD